MENNYNMTSGAYALILATFALSCFCASAKQMRLLVKRLSKTWKTPKMKTGRKFSELCEFVGASSDNNTLTNGVNCEEKDSSECELYPPQDGIFGMIGQEICDPLFKLSSCAFVSD